MTDTNFGALLNEQKTVWQRQVWSTARQNSFIMQMAAEGINNPIQRISELTKDERGTRAVVTLVPDLVKDGVVGDNDLEDNEEEAKAYDQVIEIDQIRHANRSKGRMAEQATIVRFRETSRDLLAFWLADRTDQLASLVLSGVDFRHNTDGSLRTGFSHDGTSYSRDTSPSGAPTGQALFDLAFASDVTAPSTNRHFRWDNSAKALAAGDTTAVTAADKISYAALVEAKAFAKNRRLKSMRAAGAELYHVFMHPSEMAKLKLDSDFLANVRNAGQRGTGNPLFSGTIQTVDGLVLHEWHHSFNTLGATSGTATESGRPGYKWGANADVEGNRVLFLGAQALAFADLNIPQWDEDLFDYKAKPGIAISKILGFKKPVFHSPMDGTDEDFGVMAVDFAM